jgi:tricorn protease-like protein
VTDHCTQDVITIHDLSTGGTTTIQPPAEVTGYQQMDSARFSPTGDRVAFAMAQGDPNNERGWVAVGDRSGGVAKLIMVMVGDAGSYYTVQGWLNDQTIYWLSHEFEPIPIDSYYTVQGWLDDQTLLVQSNSDVGGQLFTVGVDVSNPTKVADGSLLTVIDNR